MLLSTFFHSALWAGTALQTETFGVCFVACMEEKEKAGTKCQYNPEVSESWKMFPSPFSPVTAEVVYYQQLGMDPDSQEQQ